MKKSFYSIGTGVFIALIVFLLAACQKEVEKLPYQADTLFTTEEIAILGKQLDLDRLDYILNVTEEEQYKIILGRILFYDVNISADRSVSCASCHEQILAFADNVAFSRGALGNHADRNSISLASFGSFAAHYGGDGGEEDTAENSFFWDERAGELTEQLTETFANPNEMGMEIHEIGPRVAELDYADLLYKKAFKGQSVTGENVIEAIAAFVNTIESSLASFDGGLQHALFKVEDNFINFSEAQNTGKRLFLDNCASCHAFSLSTRLRHRFDNIATVASNGLDLEYADKGVGRNTQLVTDNGIFKIPGIRNINLTAPYMHDGRFETLREVLDFYSEGIQAHPNLDPKLKNEDGTPKHMNFSDSDKEAIISFLNTLTGVTHLDEAFSDPFKS